MNKIRALIIDDEPPAIALLEKYASMIEQVEVVGTSNSAIKAFEMIQTIDVDLLFLDIQMPVLNGLDFIKALKNPPAIILTTAYREYAYEGYDLDIIDYLLKPIPFDKFLKSIDRYTNRNISNIQTRESVKTGSNHIYFNVNKTNHKVIIDDIIYLESLKDYTRIHTRTAQLVVKGNIGTSLKKLPAERFVRIHRSFAIAMSYLKTYNQSEVEMEGAKLPIGISFRDDLMERLQE